MDFLDQRARGSLQLRYEDVAQDGRICLETLPVSLGVIWRGIRLPKEARQSFMKQGVLPILTRFTIEAGIGPFSVDHDLEVEGGFSHAHAKNDAGEVERIFLDIDSELHGPIGRTNFPPPEGAGTRAFAGRVFAEHIYTRPFAPPAERKVLALEIAGQSFVPPRTRAWKTPASTLDVAPSCTPIEADFSPDPSSFVMGLVHTDSNQHVNSLVYPRLFEEAALRRLAALGKPTSLLAHSLDIAYRRPSFAGDELRVTLRAYQDGKRYVFTGAFFGKAESDLAKARAYVQMVLE